MKTRTLLLTLLALLIVAFALPALAQSSVPFELELGYRWLDLSGNMDMYKTQVNELEGGSLRNFSLWADNVDGSLVDHVRIDASDFGTEPASFFRLDTGKSGLYNLTINYREADHFSALPAFANPLLADGILPGQHTIDRNRSMLDLELELTRWHNITPFVGYSWNQYDGPATTTYHLGQGDFQLGSYLDEKDRELRAGFSFNTGSVWGRVTQGWRTFSSNEGLTLTGTGDSNSDLPILDHPIHADAIYRTSRTDVDTPFTNVVVAGNVMDRVTLIGNYARFSADSDGTESESSEGSFISFPLSRFFDGLNESITSKAKNKTWRGGARAEVRLTDRIDLLASWQRNHRELDGSALIDSLFLDSITFGGIDRRDLETVLNATNALERDDDTFSIGLSARSWGPFAARASYSQLDQDVTVTEDLSEIVVPGAQSGTFKRTVRTLDLGGSYSNAGFTLLASWKRDRADDPVLRTDFLDRDRYRFRAAWASPNRLFRIGVTTENTDQTNDRSGIGYDGSIRQYAGDLEFNPAETFSLHGSYSKYKADSTVSYRLPQTFAIATSAHVENGKAYEGGITLRLKPVAFDAAIANFDNDGTTPFTLDRYHFRVSYDLAHSTGLAAEWSNDKYTDKSLPAANFDANRYGLYLRWAP